MSIVQLATAKAHLNITDTADDALIQGKIDAAEAYVEKILGFTLATGFGGSAGVPDDVKEAILQLVGHFYENREGSLVGITAEELPFGVWDLLAGHRQYVF
ncbi:phage gp6-like head-tail connector protein [Rhizobium laguerreae]|uniref:head-tail connector protein n=1 Tax=Rhizobium laguerreae TaxID=1076926 RepID=UPI00143F93F8|nr:head-tail connector protein [Rhizobium laguerreae]NKM86347.1 phage gp6-like head-tail connector protein [Rhizobium laguerreae]